MELKKIFELLTIASTMEQMMGLLYRTLSEKAEKGHWKEFWSRMSDDEEHHSEAINFQGRVVFDSPAGASANLPVEKAKEHLTNIKEDIAFLIAEKYNLKKSLDVSIELEKRLMNFHAPNLIDSSDKSLSKLFKSLAAADKEHIERLIKARDKVTNS